ncbi:MAG: dolichyl-P-Man:Man(5)GlcNAc(2)-PP-dolichol alpha-1,3-mannosyltransferase [Trichoglossum hirsutum]|nr:MAG: dolichyl-P-Man:Man(5)GlcNAc(2)-PP-dolichol alpha-1,3-mannosyltransferase [Trichoglossum hirsutum]
MTPVNRLIDLGHDLTTNPKHLRWLCPLLFVADAILCVLIVWKVPCNLSLSVLNAFARETDFCDLDTEIDWLAYMEQVTQYINGERDYMLIKGGTGPLVYPAAHVYIYSALYYLTNSGNILYGQIIFIGLYLGTLALVMGCYRLAGAPPYVFPLLVLSKRLHSVYLLRLFNDCFAVGALWLAIYAYQRRVWIIGSVSYSWALGIKMSVLLALPAVGVILAQAVGAGRALRQALIIGQLQILISFPFLPANALGYFSRAFEFTRVFLFRWTVNWRFMGEEIFLSKKFSIVLLLVHIVLLLLFLATRWIKPSGRPVSGFIRMILQPPGSTIQQVISERVTPRFVLTTILTSNIIGMLCARSLHYQFYAWLAWGSPFLLWRTGLHPVIGFALWGAQEWAWNVYPSTNVSSKVVVGTLAVTVFGVWWGTRGDFAIGKDRERDQKSD